MADKKLWVFVASKVAYVVYKKGTFDDVGTVVT